MDNIKETFRPVYVYRRKCKHLRKLSLFCLLVSGLVCCAVVPSTASAATYYLDAADGNDSNPGTSEQPWKTIAYAEENAQNGSTVYLRSGNYGYVKLLRAKTGRSSWDDAITFRPDAGHSPVIERLWLEYNNTDNYLIFDGLDFIFPDYNQLIPNGTSVVYIEEANYLKFLNCKIDGVLHEEESGKSTGYCIKIGHYTQSSGTRNITVQDCNIYNAGDSCVKVEDPSEEIVIKNNYIHYFMSSGVKVAGESVDLSPVLVEGNHIYNQHPLRGAHGAGIYISACNVDVVGNIVRATGNTGSIQCYGELHNGQVKINGNYNDPNHRFVSKEAVTQQTTGAKGWYYRGNDRQMYILRNQEENLFQNGYNIVSDSNPLRIWKNADIIQVRDYGGYRNMRFENNLVYDSLNSVYCVIFYDIGRNFKFNNNTIIGPHRSDKGGTQYYGSALSIKGYAHGAILNTVEFCNNITVGYSTEPKNGINFNGNILYSCGTSGAWRSQTWMDENFPGNNKVYNWGQGNQGQYEFGTSGVIFKGGSLFDTYSYTRGPASSYAPHRIDLGDSYSLTGISVAIGYANADYTSAFDILGNYRTLPPDAGCYEYIYVDPNNHIPVLQEIGNKSVNENVNLTFVVSAADDDGDTIIYLARNLPSGASFSGQTFSWTPSYERAGTYQVTFIASDGQTQDSETITITVNNVNRVPVLEAIGNKSVNEGNTLSFSVNATDADNDTIAYSVDSLPSGSAFVSKSLTWTPGYDQAGTYQLTFVASDSQGQDSETITITVNNVNRVPVLRTISNQSVYTEDPLTITVDATDTDGDTITYSASNLPSGANFDAANKRFSWTPSDSQIGNYEVTFIASDGQASDSQAVTITVSADTLAPSVTNCSPVANAVQVPLNNLMILHIVDSGKGVDANSLTIEVNNNIVYTGNTADYSSEYGHCRRTGTKADYKFIYQANELFDFDQTVGVTVNAADRAGNVMSEYSYSFETEMRSFGENKKVNSGSDNLAKDRPATARDTSGDIWAVWHAGPAGSRDIYIGKLISGAEAFGSSVRLTNDSADQCNAAITIDDSDKLYVVWQDNRQGNWDIYILTSADGINWSNERRITDSNDSQVNPVVVVDSSLSKNAYIVWQDDQAGNQDIYVASSSDDFVTKVISRITSDNSDQTEPAVVVDSDNTVYVVWMDARNGSNDIYGAASNDSWTNVPIVSSADNQSSPAIATEAVGSILHLLWVDDASGDRDVYYGASNGLPSSPLTGSSIIDDSSGADQLQPAIAVTGSTGNNLKVFACWRDNRTADTDLCFAELTSDIGTNVFVSDDNTNTGQRNPAMSTDGHGYPYLIWADSRNANTGIYYAGSTFIESNTMASEDVSFSSGATVGTELANVSSVDDVSIIVPPGAFSCDIKITVSRVKNPSVFGRMCFSLPYEFGPSGVEFDQPVIVTIPYRVSSTVNSASAYWYNPLTGTPSQQGITNVENIEISSTLHALRFRTTHFSLFFVGDSSGDAIFGIEGGGGGGGGCSMSPNSQGGITEFLLPYIGLAVVMVIIKHRDAQKRKVRSITKDGY